MLLDHNVVTEGKAEPRPFIRRLSGKEWIEYPFSNFWRNAGAIVANSDLNSIAKILGRGRKNRLIGFIIALGLALRRRVEPIRNQIEKYSRDLLRKEVDFAGGWIEGSLQSDVEPLLFGACAVIREIEALLQHPIDINGPVFA